MREEPMTKFVACKRRNVAAAYRRFLGPSAMPAEPWHSRTWAGLLSLTRALRPRPAPRAGVSDTGAEGVSNYAVQQQTGERTDLEASLAIKPVTY